MATLQEVTPGLKAPALEVETPAAKTETTVAESEENKSYVRGYNGMYLHSNNTGSRC